MENTGWRNKKLSTSELSLNRIKNLSIKEAPEYTSWY